MSEADLMREFDLSQPAAANLVRTMRRFETNPNRTTAQRRAKLPDISGTLRIEGLTLTVADQRFLDMIIGFGLSEAETMTIATAYVQAKRASKNLAGALAE